jgi:hypothetical protein
MTDIRVSPDQLAQLSFELRQGASSLRSIAATLQRRTSGIDSCLGSASASEAYGELKGSVSRFLESESAAIDAEAGLLIHAAETLVDADKKSVPRAG